MATLLEKVKTSVRVKNTTLYDDEIKGYILTCLADMDRLNIEYTHCDDKTDICDQEDIEDEISTAVIVYVKSMFGNTQQEMKAQMASVYSRLIKTLISDKSHIKEDKRYSE